MTMTTEFIQNVRLSHVIGTTSVLSTDNSEGGLSNVDSKIMLYVPMGSGTGSSNIIVVAVKLSTSQSLELSFKMTLNMSLFSSDFKVTRRQLSVSMVAGGLSA